MTHLTVVPQRLQDGGHEPLVPVPPPNDLQSCVVGVRDEEGGSLDLLDVGAVEVLLLLVVEVDGVDDVLLAVLDDLPDGAADHVAGGHGGEGDALALA